MAKNVNSLKLLRSSSVYANKEAAIAALKNYTAFKQDMDGVAALARYTETGGAVKTVVGFYYQTGETKSVTIHDFDEDAWNSLTATTETGESKVVTSVTQDKGLITTSAANLTGVKLDGYEIASAKAEIASTDTLGAALGKLQKTINENEKVTSTALNDLDTRIKAMDFTGVTTGKVITNVTETDGVVSVTASPLSDIVLVDYVKDTTKTGSIEATDTVEAALSKLENAVGAGHYEIRQLTASSANVREEYALFDSTGAGEQKGPSIKIYKDSSLNNVVLGTMDWKLEGENAQQISSSSALTSSITTGNDALVFVYQLEDGNFQRASIDVESFLRETEFKDGLIVDNGNVKVKIDTAQEQVVTAYTGGQTSSAPVLSVSADGVKASNIQTAIDAAISAKTVSGATMNGTGVTLANNTLQFSIVPATSAVTATGDGAITVQTAENGGAVTLGLNVIDAGTF
jgi:hypothetical protein